MPGTKLNRPLLLAGCVFGLVGMILGSLGSHAFKMDAEHAAWFETGLRYHWYHTPMVFVAAWLHERTASPMAALAGWLFVAGVVLFSTSLYCLAAGDVRLPGAAPVGGMVLLLGWLVLAVGVLTGRCEPGQPAAPN